MARKMRESRGGEEREYMNVSTIKDVQAKTATQYSKFSATTDIFSLPIQLTTNIKLFDRSILTCFILIIIPKARHYISYLPCMTS